MYLKGIKWNDIEWIYMAEDRDKWWALVNIVKTFRFHKMQGISDQLRNS